MRYQRVITCILTFLFAWPLWSPPITAQQGPAVPELPPDMLRPETVLQPDPILPDEEADEELISLNFSNTPVEMVLQEYCNLTGRTLLMAPGVSANITLRTQTRLTVSESLRAIESMLAMHNIALLKEDHRFVKALPIAAARQEGMPIRSDPDLPPMEDSDRLISEIIRLKHIDVGEGQKVIAELLHGYGKIQPIERINALMVTDTTANINRAREMLNQVDQPLVIREQLEIIPIRYTTASEIKAKLEEIIAQTREGIPEERPTVARPRETGPPGVIRAPRRTREPTPDTRVETVTDPAYGQIIVGNVQMVADDRTGLLIIITRPENLPFFENIVAALDVPTEPDVVVRVTRLEYAVAADVASMLNNLIGTAGREDARTLRAADRETARQRERPDAAEERPAADAPAVTTPLDTVTAEQRTKIGELSAANITILPDDRINALIIMASPRDQITLAELIEDMDMMLSQVLIEAVILEINLDKTLETGFDWVQRSMVAYDRDADGMRRPRVGFAGSGGGGRDAPRDATQFGAAADFAGHSGLSYYLTFFDLNIDSVMRAVASDTRTRILSSPVILPTDNREAEIDVSTERYFITGQRQVRRADGEWTLEPDVERERVGINLTVTPKINVKGFVVMDVVQNIDNVIGTQRIGGEDWPVISSRKLSAEISVQSGETIVLGGLASEQDEASETGVPILRSIPLLGRLFRSDSKSDLRSEVIVFMTPYVLDTPEEIRAESRRRKEVIDDEGLWKSGWSASKLAEPRKDERSVPAERIRDFHNEQRIAPENELDFLLDHESSPPATEPDPAADVEIPTNAASILPETLRRVEH